MEPSTFALKIQVQSFFVRGHFHFGNNLDSLWIEIALLLLGIILAVENNKISRIRIVLIVKCSSI